MAKSTLFFGTGNFKLCGFFSTTISSAPIVAEVEQQEGSQGPHRYILEVCTLMLSFYFLACPLGTDLFIFSFHVRPRKLSVIVVLARRVILLALPGILHNSRALCFVTVVSVVSSTPVLSFTVQSELTSAV